MRPATTLTSTLAGVSATHTMSSNNTVTTFTGDPIITINTLATVAASPDTTISVANMTIHTNNHAVITGTSPTMAISGTTKPTMATASAQVSASTNIPLFIQDAMGSIIQLTHIPSLFGYKITVSESFEQYSISQFKFNRTQTVPKAPIMSPHQGWSSNFSVMLENKQAYSCHSNLTEFETKLVGIVVACDTTQQNRGPAFLLTSPQAEPDDVVIVSLDKPETAIENAFSLHVGHISLATENFRIESDTEGNMRVNRYVYVGPQDFQIKRYLVELRKVKESNKPAVLTSTFVVTSTAVTTSTAITTSTYLDFGNMRTTITFVDFSATESTETRTTTTTVTSNVAKTWDKATSTETATTTATSTLTILGPIAHPTNSAVTNRKGLGALGLLSLVMARLMW